jgi:hypothetical protein
MEAMTEAKRGGRDRLQVQDSRTQVGQWKKLLKESTGGHLLREEAHQTFRYASVAILPRSSTGEVRVRLGKKNFSIRWTVTGT